MKKIIKVLLIIILISIIGYYLYNKYLDYREKQRIANATIKVELIDNLDIEFNTKIKLSELIKNINGTLEKDYYIDTKNIGNKEISFNYINDENIKVNYKFNINIIDIKPPLVELGSTYTINKGGNLDKIVCIDDVDDNPICRIEGEYDVNNIGSYDLKMIATDKSGNSITKDFTLKVREKKNSSNSSKVVTIPFKSLYNEYKKDNTLIGIDVSKWQGDIDFEKVKNEGVEFVIIKLGGQNGIGKDYYIDSKFQRNIEGFNKVGIPVSIYYYSHANNLLQAYLDAIWVHNNIKNYQVESISLDWENWSNINKYNVSLNTLTNIANTFLGTLSSLGYKTMLYSSKNYLEKYWLDINHDIWLAHYTSKTNYQGNYVCWQRTSSCKINGITSNTVDFDICYK